MTRTCEVVLRVPGQGLWHGYLDADRDREGFPWLMLEGRPYGPLDVLEGYRLADLEMECIDGDETLVDEWNAFALPHRGSG